MRRAAMCGKWWGTFIRDMVNLKREQTSSWEPHKAPEKEAFDILKHQLQALVQTDTLNVVVNQNCCIVWLSGFPIIHTRKMTSYHSTHPSFALLYEALRQRSLDDKMRRTTSKAMTGNDVFMSMLKERGTRIIPVHMLCDQPMPRLPVSHAQWHGKSGNWP